MPLGDTYGRQPVEIDANNHLRTNRVATRRCSLWMIFSTTAGQFSNSGKC